MLRQGRGRPKLFGEQKLINLPMGTHKRIDAVLRDGEYQTDFIRIAIARELRRREGRSSVDLRSVG